MGDGSCRELPAAQPVATLLHPARKPPISVVASAWMGG